MAPKTLDVLAVGNAIVDIFGQCEDDFLIANDIEKGVMTLLDEAGSAQLYAALCAIGSPELISGGSAANTAVGVAAFGGSANFVGRVHDDALGAAFRLDIQAAGVGFDWREAAPVWEKIKEELYEFETEYQAMQLQAMENEFGDLLFSMVNFARLTGIDPESALERTNKKFISRFKHMEKLAQKQGHKVSDLDLPTLESFWQKAKTIVDS